MKEDVKYTIVGKDKKSLEVTIGKTVKISSTSGGTGQTNVTTTGLILGFGDLTCRTLKVKLSTNHEIEIMTSLITSIEEVETES